MGRVESEGHEFYVPCCEVVQPRPLEVGRVKSGQYGSHVYAGELV